MAEFWRNIKPRRQAGLVSRFMRDLQSGFFELPRGFDVLTRYRTERLWLQHSTAPPRLRPPENNVMKPFYKQFPEAKLEPVSLSSFDPPLAKRFALRQVQLVEADRAERSERKAQRTAERTAQLTKLWMEGFRGAALLKQLNLQQQQHRQQQPPQARPAFRAPLTNAQAAQVVAAEMSSDLERIRQREVLVTGIEQVQHEEEEQIRSALQEAVARGGELPAAAGRSGRR